MHAWRIYPRPIQRLCDRGRFEMANGVLPRGSKALIGTTALHPAEGAQLGRTRLDYVDGLRALTALYVLIHHEWREIWPYEYHRYPPGMLLYLTGWLNYGHLGVSAFIVISGFCLMLPVLRNQGMLPGTVRQWLYRRGWRILPPYYAALGLSLLLGVSLISQPTGTIWDGCLHLDRANIISHLLLVHDIYGPTRINYVLWSIATEWHIYFLFPLLLLLWAAAGPRNATVIVTVLSFAVYLALHSIGIEPAWFAVVPQYVALFTFGMLAAAIVTSQEHRLAHVRETVRWEIIAAAMLVVVCVYLALFGDHEYVYADYPMGLCVAALLIACGRGAKSPLRTLLSFKPLCRIGAFSYSLYLIHAPLIQLIWQYLIHPLHAPDTITFTMLVTIGTPLIVGAAYGFYHLFERPFLHSRRLAVSAAGN